MWWAIGVSALTGYAIGSVQFGIIVGRVTRGVDIRDYGSGATGATNVIRTSGAKAGVLVIILDIAKGIVPVYIGLGLARAAGRKAGSSPGLTTPAGGHWRRGPPPTRSWCRSSARAAITRASRPSS